MFNCPLLASRSRHAVDTLSHDALEAVLVPFDGLGLVDAVRGADASLAASALGHALAWAGPTAKPINTPSPSLHILRSRGCATYMQQ